MGDPKSSEKKGESAIIIANSPSALAVQNLAPPSYGGRGLFYFERLFRSDVLLS